MTGKSNSFGIFKHKMPPVYLLANTTDEMNAWIRALESTVSSFPILSFFFIYFSQLKNGIFFRHPIPFRPIPTSFKTLALSIRSTQWSILRLLPTLEAKYADGTRPPKGYSAGPSLKLWDKISRFWCRLPIATYIIILWWTTRKRDKRSLLECPESYLQRYISLWASPPLAPHIY